MAGRCQELRLLIFLSRAEALGFTPEATPDRPPWRKSADEMNTLHASTVSGINTMVSLMAIDQLMAPHHTHHIPASRCKG